MSTVSNALAYDLQEGIKDWPKWAACSADEQCVAIHDACGGWAAVNVGFKKEGEEYQSEMAPSVDCVSDTNIEPEPKVLCINQICTVKPGGLSG